MEAAKKEEENNSNKKADNRTATVYRVMVPKDKKMLVMSNETG